MLLSLMTIKHRIGEHKNRLESIFFLRFYHLGVSGYLLEEMLVLCVNGENLLCIYLCDHASYLLSVQVA